MHHIRLCCIGFLFLYPFQTCSKGKDHTNFLLFIAGYTSLLTIILILGLKTTFKRTEANRNISDVPAVVATTLPWSSGYPKKRHFGFWHSAKRHSTIWQSTKRHCTKCRQFLKPISVFLPWGPKIGAFLIRKSAFLCKFIIGF